MLQPPAYLHGNVDGLLKRESVVRRLLDQCFDVVSRHERQHHVGLAALVTQVVYLEDVGVVAKTAHGLGLAGDAGPGGLIETFGLNDCKGDVPGQNAIVGQVDPLLAALA